MDALKSSIQEAARLKREFEGDDQRQYLHQEFVYENVMYSVKRGLPWAAVVQIANLCKELLPELRGDVIHDTASHHTTMYDFMVHTYIHHQCLYQAFLKEEVNLTCMHSHLEIHIPPHPLPLCEGTDLRVWEKQQALKELTAIDTAKTEEIHRLKEQAETQIMEKLQVSLGDLSLDDRLDKQALESMVRCFLQSEAEVVKEILIKKIRAVQELLEIQLSQTALPGAGPSSDVSGFSQKGSTSGSTKT
ncbi:hypothetical protein Q7C36_011737 [Tachysurus vachellii]|uniref:Uncharacterized protein n=1 Tax=Tachysurus vachellii TaxID=175792 RepID=A0AA88MUU8_TACVA|nr:hypothetical protein Q7C36_011737 [Tachysurus vachellii]